MLVFELTAKVINIVGILTQKKQRGSLHDHQKKACHSIRTTSLFLLCIKLLLVLSQKRNMH